MEQLTEALATSPVILFTAAFDGVRMRPDWVSENVEEILGYPADEVLEPTWWWDHLHPDDRTDAREFGRRLQEDGSYSHEYRFRCADGRWIWVLDQHRLIDPDRVVGSWTDVTALRAQSARVQAAEAHYRRLITTSPYAIYALDARGAFTELNPAGERLLGRTDLVGRAFTEIIAPRSLDATVEIFHRLVSGADNDVYLEPWIVRPDGEERLLSISATVIRDDGIAGVHGIARDVTEERRLEDEREQARQHYERLVQTSPYAIYALDLDGRFTEVSRSTAEMLGRTPEELIGRPFAGVIAPEDLHIAASSFRSKIEGRAVTTDIEVHVVRPDGERRLAHIRASPIFDGDRLIGSHGIGRDITEEHARRERLMVLGAALDHLPEGVAVTDSAGRMLYSNTAYGTLLPGGDPFTGRPGAEDLRREMQRALAELGAWRGRVAAADDTQVPIGIASVEVNVAAQTLTFTLVRDVTTELGREQQLRRAERLASVATLVGGVAHELNNPLTAIAGLAELMTLDVRAEDDLEMLHMMVREAKRAAKIVADLRMLARETQTLGGTERAPVDVNDIVQHVLKLQRYSLETSSIGVRPDLARDLPAVLGSASELEQVVLNLVVNARQALESSPETDRMLIVRTRRSATGVCLTVFDNGPGIPASDLEQIFDPFFTTKSPGEGMGLGLSLVHRIVAEHGGQVQVDSDPGRGASFVISLPALRESAGAPAPTPAVNRPEHSLRVLVVDDEEPIRRAVLRFLERRGHQGSAASDGNEALAMLRTQSFDVILSDLRMPGMGGEQLLQTLKEENPEAAEKVIFMTGHVARDDESLGTLHPGVHVIEKPFSLAELQRALEEHAARVRD